MRFAIYARYSSDRQSETSVDDQLRICHEHVARLSGIVTHVYADHAISGSHTANRPEYLKMMAAAKRGEFDAVLCEALDRLSRDQEDIAGLYKRLLFAGVKVITLAEGEVNEMHIGLKGTMNALQLKDIADKTRRGQRGRVEQGAIPGGLTYGYNIVRKFGADGEPIRGLREINEAQAVIVRRIFKDYIAGKSGRAIAAELNNEGIPSPQGKKWGASAINGNKSRKNGILNNELYVGRIVYNRQTFTKDPETGKRSARTNNNNSWITKEAPHLKIIDEETWAAVQKVKKHYEHLSLPRRPRAKHAFSGMVKCPECHGNFIAVGRDKYGCRNNKETGVCKNGRSIKISVLEDLIVQGLKKHLRDPEIVKKYIAEYHSEKIRYRKERQAEIIAATRKLADVQKQIDKMIDTILAGMFHISMKDKMTSLETEKFRLETYLREEEATSDNIIDIQPNLSHVYAQKIENLHHMLRDDSTRPQAISIFQHIVDEVIPHPPKELQGGAWSIDIIGGLANLLSYMAAPETCRVVMVAGARFRRHPSIYVISTKNEALFC